MLGSLLVSLYLSCVLAFSFVSHPIVFCFVLLLSAFSVSGFVYSVVGFSWYLVLFGLVYIGGVYVLFIFVSIHSPNPAFVVGGGLFFVIGFFLLMFGFFMSASSVSCPVFFESSYYLCSFFEGFSYCLFCLVLMVGFVCVSVVVSNKDSFFS
uniref:NADH dehydrogenase subunit 6 n=1 Tax=Tracheophilus cymbius TaxID=2502951 RepID=A0A516IAF2_9TREM|nr:NADH dehydrogenase subunit 6 [Tracheophilus cymbius]QDP13018.1 NADH dehydrogenase subunit 6 [Tracheophilus cymbius]